MGDIIHRDENPGKSDHTWKPLEQVAGWGSSRLQRRVVPSVVRGPLRKLRGWMLAQYTVRHLPRPGEFDQSLEDAMASSDLSIIVPVHDAPEVTRRCLTSLQKFAPKAEVILVDDASKLEETKGLLQEFSARNEWRLIRHVEVLGHSAAVGSGASVAMRPYLCFLNSDTVVTPWCWRPIVQAFEADSTIGVAGPSTSSGGYQTLPLAYSIRHHLTDNQICAFANQLILKPAGDALADVPSVSGFAFFIRRSLWELFGGFDQSLPDYGNEIELCRRAAGAGCRLVWVRSSYIHHFGKASYKDAIGFATILTRIQAAERYIEEKYRGCCV